MKKIFTIIATLTILSFLPIAHAQTIQDCKEDVVRAVNTTMGSSTNDGGAGYFKQLSDLMSTNMPTYTLIDEAQQLARDARIELTGICGEVGRFDSMDHYYVAAYGLNHCKAIQVTAGDTGTQLSIKSFCDTKVDASLSDFLESLRVYMLKQAIRTSVEPLVERMRSLNARLTVLLSEYGRVVSNFYTFDFRLGDTIIGQRD